MVRKNAHLSREARDCAHPLSSRFPAGDVFSHPAQQCFSDTCQKNFVYLWMIHLLGA
jgi:hypothetical protein